jgi:hypothetical protein
LSDGRAPVASVAVAPEGDACPVMPSTLGGLVVVAVSDLLGQSLRAVAIRFDMWSTVWRAVLAPLRVWNAG